MSIVIQPNKEFGLGWYIPVKINGHQVTMLYDSGSSFNIITDPSVNITPTGKAPWGNSQHINTAVVDFQVADATPFKLEVGIAKESGFNPKGSNHSGILAAWTVTRRYNVFISSQDKTLTLIPNGGQRTDTAKFDIPSLKTMQTDVKITVLQTGKSIKVPMLVDTGTSKGITTSSKTSASLGLQNIQGNPKLTIQIGNSPAVAVDQSRPFQSDIVGMTTFIQMASLYVTPTKTIVMDKNKYPIAPPISGPLADALVATVNRNPIISFTIIAVLIFASIFIVFRKHHRKL